LIYTNDMPAVVTRFCKLFADDVVALQKDMYSLSWWSDEWLLRFNVNKCKRMHIGTANQNNAYMPSRNSTVPLDITIEEIDLGVIVDPRSCSENT
jgi:hypothetical protein